MASSHFLLAGSNLVCVDTEMRCTSLPRRSPPGNHVRQPVETARRIVAHIVFGTWPCRGVAQQAAVRSSARRGAFGPPHAPHPPAPRPSPITSADGSGRDERVVRAAEDQRVHARRSADGPSDNPPPPGASPGLPRPEIAALHERHEQRAARRRDRGARHQACGSPQRSCRRATVAGVPITPMRPVARGPHGGPRRAGHHARVGHGQAGGRLLAQAACWTPCRTRRSLHFTPLASRNAMSCFGVFR